MTPPSSPHKEQGVVTADSRRVLEWLADRPSKAVAVARLAEHVSLSVPKTQGALGRLRDEGLVRYFEGEPGSWAISHRGLAEVKFDAPAESPRYRMALEAIKAVGRSGAFSASETMTSIAEAALEGENQ